MINWDIHRRVVIVGLIPIIIIALLLAGYFIKLQVTALSDSLNSRGESLASHLASASAQALIDNKLEIVHPLAKVILQEPDVNAITITKDDGTVLFRSQSENYIEHHYDSRKPQLLENLIFMRPLKTSVQMASTSDQRLHTSAEQSPPNPKTNIQSVSNQVLGWAIVELSTASTRERQNDAIVTGLTTTVLILYVCGFFISRLSRSITTPISRLTEAANEIEKGNLDVSIKTDSKGALQAIERSINNMAASLRRSRDELQEKIDQATTELLNSLQVVERQNKELSEARRDALMASKVKSEFLANMSHEIRTPMNGILGFLKLLRKTNPNEQQADYLNTIEKSANNLMSIINDILDISKIEAGKVTLKSVDYNLRDCIEEVISLLAPSAYDKKLNLTSMIYSDVPLMLKGDASKVRQILMNYVGNAIKFTDKGNIVVRTMVEEEDAQRVQIKIMVTDTGIGINELDQDRLFSTFEQVDSSSKRKFGGTGLGLAISKTLANMMGGGTGVESEPGKGSTFWFTFSHELDTQANNLISEPVSLAGYKVLYYDCNQPTRLATLHLLENWNMFAIVSDQLDALVKEAEKEKDTAPYDLILIGLSHQEMKSEFIKPYLDSLMELQQSNILILINSVDSKLIHKLESIGASACLPKPIKFNDFYIALCSLLNPNADVFNFTTHNALLESENKTEDDAVNTPLNNIKILVAEDNEINSKLIKTLLTQLGASCLVVENGRLAVEAVQNEVFDIVLMDIHMPVMNGMEATQNIRLLDSIGEKLPIIALTANAMPDDEEKYLMAGMDDVLIKPVNEDLLVQRISERLNHNQPVNTNSGLSKATKDKLTVSKQALGDELLDMLLKELPSTKESLLSAFQENDIESLSQHTHRLYGATKYCDVPDLSQASGELELAAKKGETELSPLLDALIAEIDKLLSDETVK